MPSKKKDVEPVHEEVVEEVVEPRLHFETRVEELMAGMERSHMDGMRREDAERIALAEGLKRRGRV